MPAQLRSRCAPFALEALERRTLLAADVTAALVVSLDDDPGGPAVELVDGVLAVSGTTRVDRVHVHHTRDGALAVDLNGQRHEFVDTDVTSLEIATGAAADFINIAPDVLQPASVFSGAGPDVVNAGGGSATIDGGAGRDVLVGSPLADSIDGGDGPDVIHGLDGEDVLAGGAGHDHIFGGLGDDTVDGGDGYDWISGGSGDDELAGGAANDYLDGGQGNDRLAGGEGDDILLGGAGDDELTGDVGRDILSGGPGIDQVFAVDGLTDLIFFDADDLLDADDDDNRVSVSPAKPAGAFARR